MLKKYLLIFLGALSWSLTMVKSGLTNSSGIPFWGANGHDGIWHLALAEKLSQGSLENPVFAGLKIQNYHLGFDLILAAIHKITLVPIITLYFQIFPIIISLAIGYLVYKFVNDWVKNESAAFWSTFFVYFGGSLGFLIGKGESAFWSQESVSTLINPPFALSLVLILIGMIFLLRKKYFLSVLFFGSLFFVKVYAGILVLGGLATTGLLFAFFKHKLDLLKVFLGSLLISSLLFVIFNRSSGSLIVFKPFWFLETMMQLTDRVGWVKFGEAMMNYKTGGIWIKGILAYGVAFGIFILGNFGTRIVFTFRKVKFDEFNIFIYSIIIAGTVIPMLVLQKGTPWNTIQFLYYSLFFAGILAGVVICKFNKFVLTGIVLLTIPTTILTLKDVYIPSRPPAILPKAEVEALKFLSKQPAGVVLTYPFDPIKAREAESNPPRPLFLYTSSAYVSAFSGHTTFLEDETNLDITGYDWRQRRSEVEDWYKETDQNKAREFLKQNNIKYIYWLSGQRAFFGESQLGIERIYENKEVSVFMVKS